MTVWSLPPVIKIYEALGAIADNRIEVTGDTAKVYSSSGNKYYDVIYDSSNHTIISNDNGSFWQGYYGYPMVAFLMKKGLLPFNQTIADGLKGIAWKTINRQFKNDFDQTEDWANRELSQKGINLKTVEHLLAEVTKALNDLQLNRPAKRVRPPEGD